MLKSTVTFFVLSILRQSTIGSCKALENLELLHFEIVEGLVAGDSFIFVGGGGGGGGGEMGVGGGGGRGAVAGLTNQMMAVPPRMRSEFGEKGKRSVPRSHLVRNLLLKYPNFKGFWL